NNFDNVIIIFNYQLFLMSELKLEIMGKQVKDMYGTFMGKVVGMITDSDGSIESVCVDCGSGGLKQLTFEQLLVQRDYVIYIPKWRLDTQKLLRQKNLILKRIKALQDIVTENDLMKDDAELVYIKYEKRLHVLEEEEKSLNEKLQVRLNELDTESKSIKAVLFDAKLQYKSNEVTEEIYQQIGIYTNELLEHINLEKAEINNVKTKLSNQTLENIGSLTQNIAIANPVLATTAETPQQHESAKEETAAPQVVSANHLPTEEKTALTNNGNSETDSNWLNQVISSE
ncbi:MAG: CdvA-like protein, partial [Nitrososphaeraceae archaeon]